MSTIKSHSRNIKDYSCFVEQNIRKKASQARTNQSNLGKIEVRTSKSYLTDQR